MRCAFLYRSRGASGQLRFGEEMGEERAMLFLAVLSDALALTAGLFGFGATASLFYDLATIIFFLWPIYDIRKLFF
jgi:hypothetical protein